MKKIVFTGGGSAGHVVPNLAIMQSLQKDYALFYIGSGGIEKGLVAPMPVVYKEIDPPKLIRGMSVSNLLIPQKLRKAVLTAKGYLREIQPDLIFSKGGFVALPVVMAAKALHIPAVTHESDLTLGLANRIMAHMCIYTLTSFPETAAKIKNGRYVGSPMRSTLFARNLGMGRAYYGFTDQKPVLLVLGGGSGSKILNEGIRKNLVALTEKYNILHLCGKGNLIESKVRGYVQREYEPDMGRAYAACDMVMSRAGSNTVFEIVALKKPSVLVPLQNKRSRGDQVLNAEYFLKKGLCHVLYERDAERAENVLQAIDRAYRDGQMRDALARCDIENGVGEIVQVIRGAVTR